MHVTKRVFISPGQSESLLFLVKSEFCLAKWLNVIHWLASLSLSLNIIFNTLNVIHMIPLAIVTHPHGNTHGNTLIIPISRPIETTKGHLSLGLVVPWYRTTGPRHGNISLKTIYYLCKRQASSQYDSNPDLMSLHFSFFTRKTRTAYCMERLNLNLKKQLLP